jgi:hypothetical protein
MNDELKIIQKDAVVAHSKYFPGIFLRHWRKSRPESVPAEIQTEQLQNINLECRYF